MWSQTWIEEVFLRIFNLQSRPGLKKFFWESSIFNLFWDVQCTRNVSCALYNSKSHLLQYKILQSQKYKKFRLILSCSDTTEKSISYIWYFELYDVWRCVKPKIASSIDWLEEKQKEVGNRPKNTGWISVDRITKDTLSTYNTWIQISRLQKIYHPHWAKWLFASTPLTASEGRAHRSRSLLIGASQWGWWTTLLSQHGFRLRGVQS